MIILINQVIYEYILIAEQLRLTTRNQIETLMTEVKLLIILRYSYLLDDCNYFVVTCSAVDKVLNAYYVKLLAPPTIIHPLNSKKNKNGTVH